MKVPRVVFPSIAVLSATLASCGASSLPGEPDAPGPQSPTPQPPTPQPPTTQPPTTQPPTPQPPTPQPPATEELDYQLPLCDFPLGPPLQNFLEYPVTGDVEILIYDVTFPGEPGLAIPDGFASHLESTLEANAYGAGVMDVHATMTSQLTMPQPKSFYDTGTLENMVRVITDVRTLAAGVDPAWDHSLYDYEVVISPRFWTSGPQGGGGFNRNFRVSFLTDNGLDLIDLAYHEVGHGFKFEHADYWNDDPATVVAGEFSLVPYGDKFDPMGQVDNATNNAEPHFNPRHKLWAGWLDESQFPLVTSDGVFPMRKIESVHPTDIKGIRIRRDAAWTYYLFFRGDDPLANTVCAGDLGPCNGLIITRSRYNNLRPAGDTQLINPYEPETGWTNAILRYGDMFEEAEGKFIVEVTDISEGALTCAVTFTENGGVQHAIDDLPVIDILSPAPGEILSGTVAIEVTAFDPDVSNLSNYSGIDKIVIEVNGGAYKKTLRCPKTKWSFNTALLPDGAHVFTVKAVSTNGASQTIRFRFLTCNDYCS